LGQHGRHIAPRTPTRRTAATILVLIAIVAGMFLAVPTASADNNSYQITIDMSECGVMAVGVTGTCIVSLQTWLNIFDRAGLVVDGKFGPATKVAVKNFQRRRGLFPDGRFGNASRAALRLEYDDMLAHSVDSPKPNPRTICDMSTGRYCDKGAVVPGFNGGDHQTLFCEGVGIVVGGLLTIPVAPPLAAKVGTGAGLSCSIVLN
jgi:hypothetical protein